MDYIFRIMTKDTVIDQLIDNPSKFQIGSTRDCDLNLRNTSFPHLSFSFSLQNSVWHTQSEHTFYIGDQPCRAADIANNTVFILQKEPIIAGLFYKKELDLPETYSIVKKQITIGRAPGNDLTLCSKRVGRQHASISLRGGKYIVSDFGSVNGTYVNGRRISDQVLQDGDIVTIDRFRIMYEKDALRFFNVGENLQINNGLHMNEEDLNPEYPYFRRSPRLRIVPPTVKIEIQQPPAQETKQTINWLQVFLMPAVMIGVALTIMLTVGGQSGWLMIPMSLTGTIVAVSNYFSQKKRYEKNTSLRVQRYTEYLGEIEKELQSAAQNQIAAREAEHPSCEECCSIIASRKRRLWERLLDDDDFMRLRLGIGIEELAAEVSCPKKSVTLVDDELEQKARDLAGKYRFVDGIPITIDLKKYPTCGITGPREDAIRLAKNLILQAITHHSYEDLMIVVIAPEEEQALWSDTRWLPHISAEQAGDLRCIACSSEDKAKLIHVLEDYLEQRVRSLKEETSDRGTQIMRSPFVLFVLADKQFVQKSLLFKYLIRNEEGMCVSTLLLFDTLPSMPKECLTIVDLNGVHGAFCERNLANYKVSFETEQISDALFESSMRALSPVKIEKSAAINSLPTCVSFFDGMKVRTPDELPILENWKNARIDKSLSTPIGVRANGDIYNFDIHEKASGPNGLVAGMPGSGKTEMIQTWILSMACHYSPEDISFILIDFKGSGLILPLRDLPHIAGTISDLDASIKRNLVALNSEIARRETLMRENGVHDFKEYIKLYYQNKASEKLGFLFIIVDEYAEFRAQFTDSTELMDSLMRRGRGLGMYVILMSQRIIGVASSTAEATAQFRWCLKVAGASESREMIQIPDAASIKNPGRVFIRANDKIDAIQSFWSNAPYNPTRKANAMPRVRIGTVQLNGERIYYEGWEKTVGFRSEVAEITVAIKELNRVMSEGGFAHSKRVWIAKLPKQVYLSKLLQVAFDGTKWSDNYLNELKPVVGLIDDPGSQSQYPLEIDFVEDGHLAIYGAPGTGKTTFLQTMIMSLALMYSPDEVTIYGMDFGGWSLMMFRDLPHVGEIVLADDAARIEKLSELILQELADRKKLFAEMGVGSVASYRESEKKRLPYIILVLDNFTPVFDLYPNLESFFITLTREGGNYGIYLATNANAWSGTYRIASNIKNRIVLQMSDRNDYSTIVGNTNGMEPEKYDGRGLVRINRVMEFQTALPADGASDRERAQNIKDIIRLMRENWDGQTGRAIPVIPEYIYYEEEKEYKEEKEMDCRIGRSVDKFEWLHADFQSFHYLTISGLKGAGKTNLLAALGRSFLHQTSGELVCFDMNNSASTSLQEAADRYLVQLEEIEQYMENLKNELECRKAELKKNKGSLFQPILILIDDYAAFFHNVSQLSIDRLEAFLLMGKNLSVYAAVAIDNLDLNNLWSTGEKVAYHYLCNAPNTIILGGCGKDHAAIQTDLNDERQMQILEPREGYYVRNRVAVRFKAISEYKEGESEWIRSI